MVNNNIKYPISVLHIVLTTGTGGMENVIYNLVREHDNSKLKLEVGCLDEIGVLSSKLQQFGVETKLVPKMIPLLSMVYPKRLIKFIKKSECDIVHTHSGCWLKVAVACAYLPKVKLVYTEHGRAFPEIKHRILLDRLSVNFTDRVVAVGNKLREYLIKNVKLPEKKVITIPNGIDTNRFKPSDERDTIKKELGFSNKEILIGIVARLAPVKNHSYLVNAFKIVSEKHSHARLLIIGDGPLRSDLEQLTTSLNLSDKILFLGDRSDVPRLLAGLDIVTLSSLSEGISLTLLEAMSTCLPVVATAVGGNSDLIKNDKNGFIVSLNNINEFSDKLSQLLQSSELREQMGQKGREEVISSWSLHLMNIKYQKLYEQLLN